MQVREKALTSGNDPGLWAGGYLKASYVLAPSLTVIYVEIKPLPKDVSWHACEDRRDTFLIDQFCSHGLHQNSSL